MQTAVTKDFVTEVGGGVVALLAGWPVYVLIASAVAVVPLLCITNVGSSG